MKKSKLLGSVITHAFLIFAAVVTLIPLIYTVLASLKTNAEILTRMGNFLPENPSLENYKEALVSKNFYLPSLLKNSFIYTIGRTLMNVGVSAMAGYSFAKGSFKGKNIIFACFSFMLFVKLGGIAIYPTFEVLDALHIKRTLYALLFVRLFDIPVVDIFLVRSFAKSVPDSILEAAKVDGCDFFTAFVKIALPIMKPVLATIAILAIKLAWNDYVMTTVFTLSNPNQRTLMVGLMALKNSSGSATSWNLMLAGSVISMIPIFIAYIFANKYFVSGLSVGAEKG